MLTTTLLGLALAADPASTTVPASAPHSLFNPVPQEQMRPLVTDRPDLTESAISVDAGHLQMEMDIGVFGVDRATNDVELTLMGVNLKVGLTPSADLQLVLPPIGLPITGGPLRPVGNDALIRLKYNFLGNDGSDIALGVMPFVVVNLGGLDPDVIVPLEGGVIIPFSFALPADFGLASMVQLEVNHDGLNWQPGALISVSVGHPLPVDGFGVYVESAALVEPTFTDSRVLASGGVTWGVTPDMQLDIGTRIPVVGSGGAYEGFAGISIRR
jgi:hypothetical protein